MNKSFVVALMVTISSPTAAKTKVYGQLHASYENLFPVGVKAKDKFVLNNSMIGVKGSHEIRTDVSFIYQFAWGINNDNFAGNEEQNINNLNQAIGLASPSGAIIAGRFDTPFKSVGRKADLFWSSQLGQNRNITNGNTWDVRADKVIALQSPRKNGFQTSLAYASDIADTSRITENASAISLNSFYTKGKFKLGAAYERHDLKNTSGNREAYRFSGTYKKGPLKLVGFYQNEDNATDVTASPDASVLGVGGAYHLGAGTIKFQYYTRDNDATSKDPKLLALGYDRKLTKQLDIYMQAVRITKGAVLGNHDYATETDRGISMGMRYKF